MSSSTGNELNILRVHEILLRLKISRSKFYDLLDSRSPRHDPTMPKPFKIGCSTCFLEREVNNWILQRVESSRNVH